MIRARSSDIILLNMWSVKTILILCTVLITLVSVLVTAFGKYIVMCIPCYFVCGCPPNHNKLFDR